MGQHMKLLLVLLMSAIGSNAMTALDPIVEKSSETTKRKGGFNEGGTYPPMDYE